MMLRYLASLTTGKIILWCCFIWYLVSVFNCFDPSPALWLNSLGISAIIGVVLVLSVNRHGFRNVDPWPTFRMFPVPFCVSSFSSLIKGRGFFVIVPPRTTELLTCLGLCAVFVAMVAIIKRVDHRANRTRARRA